MTWLAIGFVRPLVGLTPTLGRMSESWGMATRIDARPSSPSLRNTALMPGEAASLFRWSEEPLVRTSRQPAVPARARPAPAIDRSAEFGRDPAHARAKSYIEDLGLLLRIIAVVVRGTGA